MRLLRRHARRRRRQLKLILRARVVVNAGYDDGQLSSLLTALDAVDSAGTEAMLMALVDVPLFSASTVAAVLNRYRATHAPLVRPVSGGRHGHPIAIDRSLFALLRSADPRTGAKPIVRAHASPAGDVAVDDEWAFTDIDTNADYERAIARPFGDDRCPNASP